MGWLAVACCWAMAVRGGLVYECCVGVLLDCLLVCCLECLGVFDLVWFAACLLVRLCCLCFVFESRFVLIVYDFGLLSLVELFGLPGRDCVCVGGSVSLFITLALRCLGLIIGCFRLVWLVC